MSGFVVVSCGFDVGRLDTELPRLEHVDSLFSCAQAVAMTLVLSRPAEYVRLLQGSYSPPPRSKSKYVRDGLEFQVGNRASLIQAGL